MKNVILCGYNWSGCKALDLLLEAGHKVYVYTHEAPAHVNDLIQLCEKRSVPFTTKKVTADNLPFAPDIICSIYYRYLIGEGVIDACGKKIFNLHPSLLPEYRGCSSLTWAMIEGDAHAGFSYHYVTKRFDEGNIILQKKVKIEDFDTQQSLYFRVMFEALSHFNEVVDLVASNYKGTVQDCTRGAYYKRGCPHDGTIDSSWSAEKIERFIRAMVFPPLPYARFADSEVTSVSGYRAILGKAKLKDEA